MNKNILSILIIFAVQQALAKTSIDNNIQGFAGDSLAAAKKSILIKNITNSPYHVTLKLTDGTKLEAELGKNEETKVASQLSLGDPKKTKSYFVQKITAINKDNGQKRSYKLSSKEQKQGLAVTIGEKTEEVYEIQPFASEFNSLASGDKKIVMVPDIRVA